MFFLKKYEITNKNGDYVPCGEIVHYINNVCEMNLSLKTIGNFLNELLIFPSKNIKNIKYRNGIKEFQIEP